MEAVAAGSGLAEQLGAQIQGFRDLGTRLAALWRDRLVAFAE